MSTPTREEFYHWWSGLTNEERVSCWYDLDAMTHGEVVANLKAKLSTTEAKLATAEAAYGKNCAACGAQWMPDSTLDKLSDLVEPYQKRAREAEAKLVEAERELSDVRALDALACRYGTRLDIPSEIPGFDPGDGSDHLHFVLMPIGARSRRAAVEYLATTLLDKEGG